MENQKRKRVEKPSQDIYRVELQRLQKDRRHWDDFDGLVESVPEEHREPLRLTFQNLHDSTGCFLLDSQKLDALKKNNKPLFGEVMTYYMPYLRRLAGIE